MQIESFAVATSCCCGDRVRERLTKEELHNQFPHLWLTAQPLRKYVEEWPDRVVRLTLNKVDATGADR